MGMIGTKIGDLEWHWTA